MKIFPSYKASILYGAFGIPLFILGLNFIEQKYKNEILIWLWIILAFFVPIFLATTNIKELKEQYRNLSNNFQELFSNKSILYFIPIWKRILTVFCSFIFSFIVLKLFDIHLQ